MNWIEVICVAPIWGLLSTHLFMQAWFGVALTLVALGGILVGKVPVGTNLLAAGVTLFSAALFSGLLWLGYWLIDWLGFEGRGAANVVYWCFAVIAAVFSVAQMPLKIRKAWRNSTIPGSLEEDIAKRRMGLNPEID